MPEYTECKCGNKKRCVIALCTGCGHSICWYCRLKPVDGKPSFWGTSEPYYTCTWHPDYGVSVDHSIYQGNERYEGNKWYTPDLIKEVAQDEA